MFRQLPHDARLAMRLLVRAPLFALTAVASLAIGIGANTTIFTVANALLFAPTPGVTDPGRVVDIGASRGGAGFDTTSYPAYEAVRDRSQLLSGVYAYNAEPRPMSLTREGGAVPIYGQSVSAGFFEVLGVNAQAGAFFRASEEHVGVPLRKAVLSDRLWRRSFNADPSVVGSDIVLNGDHFLVTGVAPRGFQGTTILAPDLWVPLTAYGQALPTEALTRSRPSVWLLMGARMKPGVTVTQVRAELSAIDRAYKDEFPDASRNLALVVAPASRVPGEAGDAIVPIVAVLAAVVGLVLLIACTNLAGLLLVRAASRSREIAVRVALGARPRDLVSQLLAESLLLFALGGAAGLLLSRWMAAALWGLLPALPVPVDVALTADWRVGAFATVLALATGLLTGLAPALQSGRASVVTALKADSSAPRRQRLRHAFLSAQMGLCLLLLVVAGLFMRALGSAVHADPGFRVAGVDVVSVTFSLAGYEGGRAVAATEDVRARLAALPGVAAVAAAAVVPLGGDGLGLGRLAKPGLPGHDGDVAADWNVVSPEYLPALAIPIVNGRNFNAADRAGQPLAAIVNERLATSVWPGDNPIGKTLDTDSGPRGIHESLTIVGVARDAKYRWIGDRPRNFIYVPIAQQTWQRVNYLVLRDRSIAADASLAPDIRRAVKAFDPNLPVVQILPLQTFADIGLLPQRLAASVAGSLGTVALLLAAVGIYGVTALAVAMRTREIGIRMALGAGRGGVLRLIVGQALRVSAVGGLAGLAAAIGLAQLLSSVLFGVSPVDPIAFGSTIAILFVVVVLASFVPARRAARVDPTIALRAE